MALLEPVLTTAVSLRRFRPLEEIGATVDILHVCMCLFVVTGVLAIIQRAPLPVSER